MSPKTVELTFYIRAGQRINPAGLLGKITKVISVGGRVAAEKGTHGNQKKKRREMAVAARTWQKKKRLPDATVGGKKKTVAKIWGLNAGGKRR